jgi:two-component system sensor histidine kinase AlgZ
LDATARPEIDDAFFLPRFAESGALIRILTMAGLLALFLNLVPATALGAFSGEQLFATILFLSVLVLSFAIVADMLRPRLIRYSRRQAVVACYLIVAAIVVIFTIALNQLEVAAHLISWDAGALWSRVIHYLLLAMIVSAVLLHYLYVREQLVVRKRAELFARLDTLQARIRPHFLFNSMNTLLSLIETDSQRAGVVVEDLSALFRASLQASGVVSLYDEVVLCKRYLAIEGLRLGERLQVEWQMPDDVVLQDLKIPSLTLQPLLENAIIHGVEPSAKTSLISVLIEWSAGEVKIVVTNPYLQDKPSFEARPQSGNQMALNNTHERLQAQYGPTARLTTHRAQGLFTAYLTYPFS